MNLKYLLVCCLLPLLGYNQDIKINFDDTNNLDLIMIDTVSNPNNIWQIGRPEKGVFDEAHSQPNTIVTDTLNPYPVNDTSTFYLWYPKFKSFWEWPVLQFVYKVDTDSINDFGEIHVSVDKGANWHKVGVPPYTDIVCSCDDLDNPFKGANPNWQSFTIYAGWWSYDSLLFRFTFYSDSISTARDGWMIDNLYLFNFPQSVYESNKETKVNITPNPSQETIRIQFLDPNIRDSQELKIYSITGQLVIHQMIYPPESEINIEMLESGVYMYVIGEQRGKIVVE